MPQTIVGINNTPWVKRMENPVPLLMDKNKTKKIYSGKKVGPKHFSLY